MKPFALALALLLFATPALASETNGAVLASDKYAWGDLIGWINFAPTDGAGYVGLQITDSAVTGYAWSRDHGWINFSPSNSGQGVTNTPDGELGGYAWVADLGFISMDGVTINEAGEFVGIAGEAGTDTARISFDCSTCSVATDWRPASARGEDADASDTAGNTSRQGGARAAAPAAAAADAPATFPASIVPAPIRNLFPGLIGAQPAGQEPGVAGGAAEEAGTAGIPRFLFDISLRIEENTVAIGQPLLAIVSFTSFGTEETPVDTAYAILDSGGKVVATSTESFIVQTERTFTRRFDTGLLTPGRYTLHLHVSYGAGTIEDLEQEFVITDGSGRSCFMPWPLPWLISHLPFLAWLGCWLPWWILLIVLIAIILGVRRHLRHKRLT